MNLRGIAALSISILAFHAGCAAFDEISLGIPSGPPPGEPNHSEDLLTATLEATAPTGDGTQSSPVVHVVYLVPTDKPILGEYQSQLSNAISNLQYWYRDHEGNSKTFALASPAVATYRTAHTSSYYKTHDPGGDASLRFYTNALNDAFALTGGKYNDPSNVWLYYIDADYACGQVGGAGTSGVAILPANDLRGLAGKANIPPCTGDAPNTSSRCRWVGGVGHELGHALGLDHPVACTDSDPKTVCPDTGALMWTGYTTFPTTDFLPADRTILNASPFIATRTLPPKSFTCATSTAPKLLNLSTRARVETGANVMIGGFIVGGTGTKSVLVRALGPSLAAGGIIGPLANPTMQILNSQGTVIATNDNWKTNQAAVEATGAAPTNDLESAAVLSLAPGSYTVIVSGVGGTSGVGLVEAYDLNATGGSRLINISTRAKVLTGQNVMIGGLTLGAGLTRSIAFRALGPSLTSLGVVGAMANPQLTIFDSTGTQVAYSDNWRTGGQVTDLTALGLAPTNDNEAAVIVTLGPGLYTAVVSGVGNTTGVALVEAYEL